MTESAPSAAPSEESVSVEKNSAIAASPIIDTVTNPTVASTRSASSAGVSGAPDGEVHPPGAPTAAGGALPRSMLRARREVATPAPTASSTNTIRVISSVLHAIGAVVGTSYLAGSMLLGN